MEKFKEENNYREARCCFNCKHCSLYDDYFSSHWCQNDETYTPVTNENEYIKSRLISEYMVCDKFKRE